MWTACLLAKRGAIDPKAFVDAVDEHLASRPQLGRIALAERLITVKQVVDVLSRQADTNEPFGKIAVQLGYLTEHELAYLLLKQTEAAKSVEEILIDGGAISRDVFDVATRKLHQEIADEGQRSQEPLLAE